jgi:carbon storage regulator
MLVLSRKQEEEIIIADTVVVKVLEICGDKVRLGFKAPGSVSILRRELIVDLKPANKESESSGMERQNS